MTAPRPTHGGEGGGRCPHCGQTMPQPRRVVRICFDCSQPITRHAKWAWVMRGGTLTLAHRHCENPESYHPKGAEPLAPAPLFDGGAT